uniref:ChrR-like cupin domain-containing protein n=1 Tax=Lotharella oceanica TaxID=641309 RepID=A0A7S2TV05_9EUKA
MAARGYLRGAHGLRRILLGASAATLFRAGSTTARAKSYKTSWGEPKPEDLLKMNADFDEIVAVDTTKMEWAASPMPAVERKRVFLHGTKEAGKVTSVVRYAPGSKFRKHPHPEGEEFLVLKGVFSDDSGDYGPGTYCLNPEGFVHAPWSKPGCEIIVRLRQHPNLEEKGGGVWSWLGMQQQQGKTKPRTHTVVLPHQGNWVAEKEWGDGVTRKMLYQEDMQGYEDATWLEKVTPGSSRKRGVPQGMVEEVFVIEGCITAAGGSRKSGTWIRHPEGTNTLQAEEDTTLYVRQFPIDMIAPSHKGSSQST